MEMLNVPVTREAHSPGFPGALRSLQPSTLQVPEGGGEGDGTDLTRGTNTLAQHPVEKHLLWGRRRAQGSGWGGRQEGRAPTPFLCSPRPRVHGWVGAGCTGGLLEREVEGSK